MWIDSIALNTSRPLFASARLRRAVNYAIDRRALVREGGLNFLLAALPTDQYVPPGMPGFADARIYPFRPNLEKARRLARSERHTATLFAFSDSASAPQLAEIIKSNLKRIGIDVEVKLFKRTVYLRQAGVRHARDGIRRRRRRSGRTSSASLTVERSTRAPT